MMKEQEYIDKLKGKILVLKIGGEVIEEPSKLSGLAQEVDYLYNQDIKFIVVHGCGGQISKYSREIGLEPEIFEGLRVTDKETLEKAVMPVMRKINSDIAETLNKYELYAISLQIGYEPDLITAKKAPLAEVTSGDEKVQVDLGLVGEVVGVNTAVLYDLLTEGYTPVISSLGMDSKGTIYNINADDVAGAIAGKIEAEKLIILTDVLGVYKGKKRVSYMSVEEAEEMIQKGEVDKGMIRKLMACIDAVQNNVPRAHIISGIKHYNLPLELMRLAGVGTMILSQQEKEVYEKELRMAETTNPGSN